MCGIAGVAGSRPNSEVLARMGRAIAHRGPNEASETVLDDAGFAFRRLSIIDVAGGQQPIWNEREDVAILLNGEIYNHHQLRPGLEQRGHRFRTRSDVETVLHLWEEKGADCLTDLRGMFALAIWDTRTSSLFLARDRLGKKPLYYSEIAGGLVFGSEIKALLQHPAVQREPNLEALELFLSLHYVPTPVTAFAGVQRLPPGHWLAWRAGRLEVGRYWDLAYGGETPGSESELREETLRLLRESVAIRLESEVPLGAFLSGGLDSSTVVALAAEASSEPLKTFSIGFGARDFDESDYARLVARHFGTDHHELRLDEAPTETIHDLARQFDQPFGDSSAIPTLQVAKITQPYVTVVLTGDGGDETFAGYDRYRLARLGRYFALPRPILQGLYSAAGPFGRYLGRAERILRGRPNSLAEAYLVTLFQPVSLTAGTPAGDDRGFRRATEPMRRFFRRDGAGGLDSMLAADVHHYLPDDLLVKMDMATMAHSLEARSPLLDHRLMEFTANVGASVKMRGGESKRLLKLAMEGILPPATVARSKRGFGVPLAHWLRTDLADVMRDSLLSDRAAARRHFNPSDLKRMVDDTLAGTDIYRFLIWDLITLELWQRTYIDAVPALS
jgi:asparagine synthase (glutamine-hydrolysing)